MKLLPPLPKIEAPAADRDLALDAVRAWSLAVVVFGHFLMQIGYWTSDGFFIGSNTLSSGRAWPFATWLLQVMPLFFLAGGAVNRASLARHQGDYSQWMWKRIVRLVRPTLFLLVFLGAIFTVITPLTDLRNVQALCIGIVGPLWFLGIYIPVISLTKFTVRWHERFGFKVIIALFIVAVAIDIARFNINENLGTLNALVAWVLAHQLGYFYDDGINKRLTAMLAVGAIGINLILTQWWQFYPTSMVGLPSDSLSNINPPTTAFVFHIIALCCMFMTFADRMRGFLRRPWAYRATARLGLLAMSLFLWHMPVLVAWYGLAHVLHLDLPTVWLGGEIVVPAGPSYWLAMIPWTALYVLTVYGVLRIVWPLEYVAIPWLDRAAQRGWRPPVWLGVTCVSLGMLAIAGTSFAGFPFGLRTLYGLPISNAAAVTSVAFGLIFARAASQPLHK